LLHNAQLAFQQSVAQALALLNFIWKVPASNLGRETGYPDRLPAFAQFLQQILGY
jgi:hypothetical protein